jgi:hypothetical protein
MSTIGKKTFVQPLFDYRGTCLECGKSWTLTPEQIQVAVEMEIAYSPCCEKPATLVKMKAKRVSDDNTKANKP